MQLIIQHLFQASTLEVVSRQRLETFVEEYPSFGIGRYLLSRKLRTEDADSFMTETQKTSLYFSNPFWLQWQLDNSHILDGRVTATEQAAHPAAEPEPALEEATATLASPALSEYESAVEEEIPAQAEQEPAYSAATETQPAETSGNSSSATIDHDHHESGLPNAVALAEAYGGDSEDTAPLPTGSRPEETHSASTAAELLLQSIQEARGLRETLQKMNDDFPAAVPAEPTIEHPTLPITATDSPIHDEEPAFVLVEESGEVDASTELPAVMPEVEDEPISAANSELPEITPELTDEPAQAKAGIENEPAIFSDALPPEAIAAETAAPAEQTEPAEPEQPTPSWSEQSLFQPGVALPQQEQVKPAHNPFIPTITPLSDTLPLFEPYHTIDYFASQGIKLSVEELPNDQLGRQLKSFTEWLKTMRRLPQKDREIVPDRVAEQTIQSIAAHSIESKETITETMAEVLAKQGMPDKARVVYEKLSLLNPDKRAYFASKIEQLNFH